jgi:hypothetical protein
LPEKSARRSATVTISVPLALNASRISSFEANFPVPTSKRDVNSRSAIFSLEGLSAIAQHKRIHKRARMPQSICHPSTTKTPNAERRTSNAECRLRIRYSTFGVERSAFADFYLYEARITSNLQA